MKLACVCFALFVVVSSVASAAFAADCPKGSYTIEVEYTWTASDDTDANPYPSNAHFSPMVCALSNEPAVFVAGETATEGFKELAETGAPQTLVNALTESSNIGAVEQADGTAVGTSTGKFELTISADGEFSYLMCASMIAPSPDWVVGIPSTKMCDDNGEFSAALTKDLVPYDAGTDSGTTYAAADEPTSPQGTISAIDTDTVAIAKSFGTISVTAVAASEADAVETAEEDSDDDDSDSGVCFPASATVETEDGNHVRMADLAVGTSVKVADGSYSPVFMFTHKLSAVRHPFVRLTTASGRVLSLTPSHYLYVDGELRAASTVRTGSSVVTATGHADEVVAVETVSDTGLYNPQTLHGDIVVNGVVASTYTTSVEPTAAHSLLAPVRALYKAGLGGVFAQLFHNGASTLASAAPSGADTIVA